MSIAYLFILMATVDDVSVTNIRMGKPLFDGYVKGIDSRLRLEECECYDLKPVRKWRSPGSIATDFKDLCLLALYQLTEKKLRSTKYTKLREIWVDYGLVAVFSWHFEYSEDAALYPYVNKHENFYGFRGWSENPEIGDNTTWVGENLYFTKGRVFVFIQVNPDSLGRDFVRSIAGNVMMKL